MKVHDRAESRLEETPNPAAARIQADDRMIAKWGRALIVMTLAAWAIGAVTNFTNGLTIITAGGLVAAVFGLRNPAIGLLGLGILCTTDAVARNFVTLGGLFRFNTLNYFLLAVAALNFGRLLQLKYVSVKILMAFTILMGLQLFYSRDFDGGLQYVFAVGSAFGLIAVANRAPNRVVMWEWFGLLCGVVGAVGTGLYFVQGTLKLNYNALAYFPLTALFCTCLSFVAVGRYSKTRLLLLLLSVLNAAWVFLTTSRGGTIVALSCLLLLTLQLRRPSYIFAAIVAVLAVGAFISIRFSESEEASIGRFERLFDAENRGLSDRTSGRSDLFAAGWQMFQENPYLGAGTGSFPQLWLELSLRESFEYMRGRVATAHSGWLMVLVENGIFGFMLFFAFVYSFAVVGWGRRRLGVFPIGLLVTVVLSVALLTTEFNGKGLWFLAAVAVSILHKGFPDPGGPAPRPALSRRRPFRRPRVDRVNVTP